MKLPSTPTSSPLAIGSLGGWLGSRVIGFSLFVTYLIRNYFHELWHKQRILRRKRCAEHNPFPEPAQGTARRDKLHQSDVIPSEAANFLSKVDWHPPRCLFPATDCVALVWDTPCPDGTSPRLVLLEKTPEHKPITGNGDLALRWKFHKCTDQCGKVLQPLALGTLIAAACTGCSTLRQTAPEASGASLRERGEFGGDLNFVRKFYSVSGTDAQQNHFIQIAGKDSLRDFAVTHGLTNNHALFVDAHGTAIPTRTGMRYAYCADAAYHPSRVLMWFSARDLARVLGPNSNKIHNLVIAACNKEGAFCARELRNCFPNATNIIHARPQTDAKEWLYRWTLVTPSQDVEFLCDKAGSIRSLRKPLGKPARKPKAVRPYMAQLYRPGDEKPFRCQVAGKELLIAPARKASAAVAINSQDSDARLFTASAE